MAFQTHSEMWLIENIRLVQTKSAQWKITNALSFLWRTRRLASHPTPANAVVVEVLASLWAKHLDHHAVQVEAFHQHPGEGAQEEEVKQDSHDLAGQLVER